MVVHYIAADGTGSWADSLVLVTPCSWATMLANAAAGDDCRVMTGTYSRTTSSDGCTNAGTVAAPILIQGADASGNPLTVTRTLGGTGPLDTTGMPVITFTSGQLAPGAKNYLIFRALSITSAKAGAAVSLTGVHDLVIECSISTSSTNAAATAVTCTTGNGWYFADCDCSAPSGAAGAVSIPTTYARIERCRFTAPGGYGLTAINSSTGNGVHNCVFFACDIGYKFGGNSSGQDEVTHSTFYGCTTAAMQIGNTAYAAPFFVSNCIITDCGMAIKSLYAATGNLALVRINNRTRDNTSADAGFDGWPILNPITTDTGGPETDYIDAAGGDFRLKYTSPGRGAASDGGDCGACPYDPNLPTIYTVQDGVFYGQANEFEGTYIPELDMPSYKTVGEKSAELRLILQRILSANKLLNTMRVIERIKKSGGDPWHDIANEMASVELDLVALLSDSVTAIGVYDNYGVTPVVTINEEAGIYSFGIDINDGGVGSILAKGSGGAEVTGAFYTDATTYMFKVGDTIAISNAENPLSNGTYTVGSFSAGGGKMFFTALITGADNTVDTSLQMIVRTRT